jgi:hypothetical protein
MQQILQQPKGRKTKLTNLTKECNNKSCNPEGKKNLLSHICKMQHYDHATNQPHNPATKCNKPNSCKPKEEKEPSLTNLQNATSSYTTNHASRKKTQHTKSCNPKEKKTKTKTNLINLANCPKGRKSPWLLPKATNCATNLIIIIIIIIS